MKVSISHACLWATVASAASTPTKAKRANKARAASLPTVTVRGNAFFAGDNRFYIKGLDYQPGGSSAAIDPIANAEGCMRDVEKFKELGINTIRVYTVDNSPDVDHDPCMNALADAGIYLALDVNTPLYSLNRNEPAGSYNDAYLQNVFATVSKFAGYSNTLLFFSGNEVINADNNTNNAPYIKATTRDIKSYLAQQDLRRIPVGYSAADVSSNRYDTATYMNCGTDDQRSDFFAFNDYSWCDPSSYTVSGWDQKVATYSNYSIPLFLSEFGCITNTRAFGEIPSLYSANMTPVYSGGLVYEYSEEGNGYGLVNIRGNSVQETADFRALRAAYAALEMPTGDGGYKQDLPKSQCPSASSTWEVHDFEGDDLPAIPDKAVQYLDDGAGDGAGLNGPGSQWDVAGASDSTASAGSGSGGGASGGGSSSGGDNGSDDGGSGNAAGALRTPVGLLVGALIVGVGMVVGGGL